MNESAANADLHQTSEDRKIQIQRERWAKVCKIWQEMN